MPRSEPEQITRMEESFGRRIGQPIKLSDVLGLIEGSKLLEDRLKTQIATIPPGSMTRHYCLSPEYLLYMLKAIEWTANELHELYKDGKYNAS